MRLFRKSKNGNPEAGPPVSDGKPSVAPRHLTGEEFGSLIAESSLPVVVDFWAEWCGPCHAIAPAVQALAAEFEGRAVVAKLNADEYPDVLMHYGIMGIPTLIYFKGGVEVDRSVGLTSYGNLKNRLMRLLC